MKSIDTIKNLHKKKITQKQLKLGSDDNASIEALQNVLYDLGFGRELKWDVYGADGEYGHCTATAVEAFCNNNKIRASGKAVSGKTAEQIIHLYELIDELKLINEAIQHGEIETRIKLNGRYKAGVAALQTLLAELGYKRQLKWNKYGADGEFGPGTLSALKKYSEDQNYLDNGEELTEKLAGSLLNRFKPFYGPGFLRESIKVDGLTQTTSGKNVIISDDSFTWTFRKFKKGLFTYGKNLPKDFIDAHPTALSNLGLSKSLINVMLSVSENEGNLDAVNTWDNAFLSFGMFQWTLGTSTNGGELPALLKKLKNKTPSIFEKYFLSFGLDVFEANDKTGFISLDGQVLNSSSRKEKIRNATWAYRFWKAGQDEIVMALEVEHAASRINAFYKSSAYKVDRYYISDLVKSEYGVALLLDNHVNRPSYLVDTLKSALKNSDLTSPDNWDTKDEEAFLKEYLTIRKIHGSTPMTDSDRRTAVTKKSVSNGTISKERGSFKI